MLRSASEAGNVRSRRPPDMAIPIRSSSAALVPTTPDHDWPQPDLSVLRLGRRPPPPLPLGAFGPAWEPWIVTTAAAASCPVDYVAAPLLASVSALIGHSRWAEATPGWIEPSHLWIAALATAATEKARAPTVWCRTCCPRSSGTCSPIFQLSCASGAQLALVEQGLLAPCHQPCSPGLHPARWQVRSAGLTRPS